MSNEQPTEEAVRLQGFLGDWKVEGTIRNGDSQDRVSGDWRFERAIDGWGVRGILNTDIEGFGAFEESAVIGYDAAEARIHLFSSNKLTIRDHIGGWTGEDQLRVRYEGTSDGKKVAEEIAIRFEEPDRIVGRVIEWTDDVVAMTTELTLVREN